MAYDYLGLTNRVLRALNEVELTSGTFTSATGFHSDVKDAVNMAIRDVYQEEDGEWPFAYEAQEQALTVPTSQPFITEYALDTDIAKVDWETFYIERDDTLDPTQDAVRLPFMDYDAWAKERRDEDLNKATTDFGVPNRVVRLLNNKWTVSPVPDQAYTIKFNAFTYPTDLSGSTDVPSIPEAYEQVIVDKALHYAYMFRDNMEQANIANKRYENGVNRMRRQLIPLPFYMRFSF